jgi:aspartokinase
MITIRSAILDTILNKPFLEEGLSSGLINLSALARMIKPELAKKLYKQDISDASLIMALKRIEPEIKKKTKTSSVLIGMEDITVRSDLVEITVQNSPEAEKMRKEIMKIVADEKALFFNFIQGVQESTIVMSRYLEKKVTKQLEGNMLFRLDCLSSITFALPPANRKTPGVYYTILKALAWENINLVEIMSNHNEVTLVFDGADIDRAFSVVKGLKK